MYTDIYNEEDKTMQRRRKIQRQRTHTVTHVELDSNIRAQLYYGVGWDGLLRPYTKALAVAAAAGCSAGWPHPVS